MKGRSYNPEARSEPHDPLPADHEAYGVVHERALSFEDALHGDLSADNPQHICRVDDGQPLCEADVDPDAPIYPFRGRRRAIRRGLEDCCDECRVDLKGRALSEKAADTSRSESRAPSDRGLSHHND